MSLSMIPYVLRNNIWADLENALRTPRSWYADEGFPVVDQFTEDGKTVLEFALAGYSPDDLSVRFEDGALIVAAEKKDDRPVPEGRRIAHRAFEKRYFQRDSDLRMDEAAAKFVNGVLRIEIPWKECSSTPKKIEIGR